MSNLIVIGFDNEVDAFEMRSELAKLQIQYLIEMEDAVVATRDVTGKVKLHQPGNLVAETAVRSAFMGMLVGMLLLNPLMGAAVGAASGAMVGKFSDIGINDEFMKNLSSTIAPGSSALFVLVRKSNPEKVLAALAPFARRGRVLQSSLTKDKEEELQAFMEGR